MSLDRPQVTYTDAFLPFKLWWVPRDSNSDAPKEHSVLQTGSAMPYLTDTHKSREYGPVV